MDMPLFDFILVSLLMGLGIGIDVAVATVARARQLNTFRLAMIWVVGVSLTHTLFPMVGYLLAYFSVQVAPGITPLIGILAFVCIFIYLKGELQHLLQPEQGNEHDQLLLTLGLILAVSWDALWSGPAKSAQVIGWPELLVWISFVVVGVLVSMLAISSLRFARVMMRFAERREYMSWLGYWLQYSVIGYFGVLALLRYTLQIDIYWWQVLLISTALVALALTACLSKRANHSFVKI